MLIRTKKNSQSVTRLGDDLKPVKDENFANLHNILLKSPDAESEIVEDTESNNYSLHLKTTYCSNMSFI